ncbi:GNAT family N-acetyltransferase [Sutcliffiella deserti]|uniref:GNAT family N-acetyltransferase n=1 Tax=Sutcliffiella deserti TaxID=2875501 RepID=UPI001CC06E4F|nr:GNAT family N-acetyltransferase [Sutcliffiella deserti]
MNGYYKIRNYLDQDADKIAEFNFLAMLAYRYNKDYEPANIFCAVDSEDTIVGVGHLEPDQPWTTRDQPLKQSNFIYKLNLDMYWNHHVPCPSELQDELLNSLLARAREISDLFPDKNIRVSYIIPADELEEVDYFLARGFTARRTHFIMKRDLTEEIPNVPLIEGILVVHWKMETQAEQEKYLRAEAEAALDGISWSLNRLKWMKSGSAWDTFTAFKGDEVVGSVMTWGLGEERSATENIFVLPDWRRKGIARAVITEALHFLKNKGMKEATLSVYGDNESAIALYKSLGYQMLSIHLEFGIDL